MRSDPGRISPSSPQRDDAEWDPSDDPQGHVEDGNFGCFDFGRNSVLICVAAQRSDIHFFGLFAQFIFVFENSLDDGNVASDDDDKGYAEAEDEAAHDVRFIHHCLGEGIVRTPRREIAFYITISYERLTKSTAECVCSFCVKQSIDGTVRNSQRK